ncbi:HAD domain-containing protein [Actinokineospora sp. HUAS TT18]|uniref:HAD domain-containing protein n=1 Tax=Actinokineospora sp. HUAS TT18 TaxID=3447451 RepID=UPI003F5237D6
MTPLILLDVDGPLNPFAGELPDGFVEHRIRLSRWNRRKVLRLRLNPTHGPALCALAERTGARLTWATTWGHRANTVIAPVIGLPPLPVIDVSSTTDTWKYPAVARHAGNRPLIWLDDDFDLLPVARDRFLADRQAPTELYRVDPRRGLSAGDLAAVEEWLLALP